MYFLIIVSNMISRLFIETSTNHFDFWSFPNWFIIKTIFHLKRFNFWKMICHFICFLLQSRFYSIFMALRIVIIVLFPSLFLSSCLNCLFIFCKIFKNTIRLFQTLILINFFRKRLHCCWWNCFVNERTFFRLYFLWKNIIFNIIFFTIFITIVLIILTYSFSKNLILELFMF